MRQADSENFCLKWNDFLDNVTSSFAQLRSDKNFSDVTLASGDGHQTKAHRVVLASGSLVFKGLLTQNSAANPVIFMRGVKSEQLNSIVDFLYLGEINIHQDGLNEFLALAEDLQLKGLTENRKQAMETSEHPETKMESANLFKADKISKVRKKVSADNQIRKDENIAMASEQDASNILSVMEDFTSEKAGKSGVTFKDGNDALETEISKLLDRVDGTSNKWACLSCGKIDQKINIKKHIEGHHIERRDHFCNFCGQTFRSRNALQRHSSTNHRILEQ